MVGAKQIMPKFGIRSITPGITAVVVGGEPQI